MTPLIMTSYLQNLSTMELEGCLMIGSTHTKRESNSLYPLVTLPQHSKK